MIRQNILLFSKKQTIPRILLIFILGLLNLSIALSAEKKPPATFADYSQWETLTSAGSYGGFSPDGQWLVYAINRSNRDSELRITKLADNTTKTAPFGTQPVFSSDSKWLAYSIGRSEAEQEKLRKEKKPAQNKLGLLNLLTDETITVDGIESFSFSKDGAFLAMQRYRPEYTSDSDAPPGRDGRGRDSSSENRPLSVASCFLN